MAFLAAEVAVDVVVVEVVHFFLSSFPFVDAVLAFPVGFVAALLCLAVVVVLLVQPGSTAAGCCFSLCVCCSCDYCSNCCCGSCYCYCQRGPRTEPITI